MAIHLICTPQGHWGIRGQLSSEQGGIRNESLLGLSQGDMGQAQACLFLLGEGLECAYEAGFSWLRGFLGEAFSLWLKQGGVGELFFESGSEISLLLSRWKEKIPPLIGEEYVSIALMQHTLIILHERIGLELLWKEVSLSSWAETINEHWSLVGRIVLHLADVGQGGERPFAFLATYAEGLSASGRPLHIPLGRVLLNPQRTAEEKTRLIAPLRHAATTSPWLAQALSTQSFFRAEAWTIEEAYAFIQAIPVLEKAGLMTRMPASFQSRMPARVQVLVDVGKEAPSAVSGRPLWDFSLRMALNGEDLTEEEWANIQNASVGLISLRGKWVEIDAARSVALMQDWDKLRQLYGQGFPLSVAMRLMAGLGGATVSELASEEVGEPWCLVQAGQSLTNALRDLRHPPVVEEDALLNVQLRPYQQEGVAWLAALYRARLGGCLADDMGLGKTVQVIAFLSFLARWEKEPVCIVAPVTLLSNWQQELRKFAPHLRVLVYHGRGVRLSKALTAQDIIVTTYSYASQREELRHIHWSVLVMDEAQQVKNPSAQQSIAMTELSATMKLALTGTPIENGLKDLWSLMNIVNPQLLGSSWTAFSRGWNALAEETRYATLRTMIAPFILRRMKSDPVVGVQLPPKTEIVQCCLLTHRQGYLYAHLAEELKKQLFALREEEAEKIALGEEPLPQGVTHPRNALIIRYMMKFKQLCNHPSLLNGDNSFESAQSGKFLRLEELAEEWALRQEKVLVFTQFREMIAPLERLLTHVYGVSGLVMHGGHSQTQRAASVLKFQQEEGPPFFVLSLKTAGTGLTLTQATHVVHFDRWWNPAVENQASDRTYRLGQTKPVFIHKFITPATVEEKIHAMLEKKSALAQEMLETAEFGKKEGWDAELSTFSDEELVAFFSPEIEF